jgi:hypothetical protein
MIKRFVLFLLLVSVYCGSVFAVDITGCSALASGTRYNLTQSFTAPNANCYTFGSNIDFNMQGYTVTGNVTKNGFHSSNTVHSNVTIRNGIITNFKYGVYNYEDGVSSAWTSPVTFVNMTFIGNADYDFYSYAATYAKYTFINCTFSNAISFSNMHTVIFEDVTINNMSKDWSSATIGTLNVSGDKMAVRNMRFNAISSLTLDVDNITANTIELISMASMENINGNQFINIIDLCGSTYTYTGSNTIKFKMTGHMTTSGRCIDVGPNAATRNNMVFDLGGYNLTGDGTEYAFYMSGINHKNIILQNGVIDNWNRAFIIIRVQQQMPICPLQSGMSLLQIMCRIFIVLQEQQKIFLLRIVIFIIRFI